MGKISENHPTVFEKDKDLIFNNLVAIREATYIRSFGSNYFQYP